MSKFTKEKYKEIYKELPILINQGLTGRDICSKLNISKSALWRALKKNNLNIPNYHNMLKFDNTVFDKIDTEEKAYWLGFLYADGNVHSKMNIVSISLSAKDKNHLEKFNKFLKNTKEVVDSTSKARGKEYPIAAVMVCDKHLKQRLIELGCHPNKTKELKFPDINIFEDKNLVYDFIRGFVDGDGCLTFERGGRLSFSVVGTYDMLEGISNIFKNRFQTIRKLKRVKSFDLYCIGNSCKNADYVATKLYKHATIYLERKYERFALLCRNTQLESGEIGESCDANTEITK